MQVHLLDATYELFRAHFGRPPRVGIDGEPVGATLGVVESVLSLLREDGAGAVVLLPTCSLCVQTVGLLARALEEGGLPTVAISMLPELSARVGTPRTLAVRFPFGAPCGRGLLARRAVVEPGSGDDNARPCDRSCSR